jgi:hypothetical protein
MRAGHRLGELDADDMDFPCRLAGTVESASERK